MTLVHRVLFPKPIMTLEEYIKHRGGRGLDAALAMAPEEIVACLAAAGLRGRGGAGFPTATKWQTIIDNRSADLAPTVVVNGAEGEPGTFKDRSILRADPYVVVEGAIIAAHTVGADLIAIGLKHTFRDECERVRAAVREMQEAGCTEGLSIAVIEGPNEYLYGEETAMLEVIDGRYPFPRIQPPFRRGVTEVWAHADEIDRSSGLSANIEMAGPTDESVAPPALVDNIETFANVPGILARGPEWFRTEGTDESPGTIVCTVTGSTLRDGVGEVPMGTPLRKVIDAIGGGVEYDTQIKAVISGVSNPVLTAEQLDAPCSYEGMQAVGTGLGTGGFLVFDESVDMVSVAAGVSRFLAVESCGQCTPCKQDGLSIAEHLAKLCRNEGHPDDLETVRRRLGTVADGARCFLASQQQALVGSLLERFPAEFEAHARHDLPGTEPYLIAELLDVEGYRAVVDERFLAKQPDWTHDGTWSGRSPVEKFTEHRLHQELED